MNYVHVKIAIALAKSHSTQVFVKLKSRQPTKIIKSRSMSWAQTMVLSLFRVQGVKCCGCFGSCSEDNVVSFPSPSPDQHRASFMNLNDSRPINCLQSTLKNSNEQSKVNDDLILSTDSSYYCCNTIVNDLPYSWPSHSEQARNQLIRKCIKRWHELSADIRVDPCILCRPSDSRTSNLIVFKLDRTIVDTKLVAAHSI